jgi:ABC-2 type transport system ATP-binding protein
MEQAEKLCAQLCIIARGRKLVDGPLAEIKRTHGGQHLTIGFDGHAGGGAVSVFADKRLVRKVDEYGQYAELELAPDADPQELLRGLVQSGVRLSRFELTEPTLHKIFIDLVGRDPADGQAGAEDVGHA